MAKKYVYFLEKLLMKIMKKHENLTNHGKKFNISNLLKTSYEFF